MKKIAIVTISLIISISIAAIASNHTQIHISTYDGIKYSGMIDPSDVDSKWKLVDTQTMGGGQLIIFFHKNLNENEDITYASLITSFYENSLIAYNYLYENQIYMFVWNKEEKAYLPMKEYNQFNWLNTYGMVFDLGLFL